MAGHDALIKFSEETNEPRDIDKSMYISIFISVLLVAGVCLAAIVCIHDFRTTNVNDIIADIFEKTLNHGSGKFITIAALIIMVGTTFLGFLSTIRYIYGIPDKIKFLEFLKSGGDGHVSPISIILTAILCLIAVLVNQTTSLIEIADIGLIIVLLLVASSSFIEKYKDNNISIIDGLTSGGFLGVLGLAINKHFIQ